VTDDTTEQKDEEDALVLQPRVHHAPPFPSVKSITFYARDADGQWFIATALKKWLRMTDPR
jgi:hypothetical protein